MELPCGRGPAQLHLHMLFLHKSMWGIRPGRGFRVQGSNLYALQAAQDPTRLSAAAVAVLWVRCFWGIRV